ARQDAPHRRRGSDPLTYTIPVDNPFVDDPVARDEIWALGMRNPWRFSFDQATGDLFIGDVGQDHWEEIDYEPADDPGGHNYGWRCYEGSHVNPNVPPCKVPDHALPVIEYAHENDRCSVTGGHVYRGSALPALHGIYVYADLCTGEFWGLQQEQTGWSNSFLGVPGAGSLIISFGEDEEGELYVATWGPYAVYRIVSGEPLAVTVAHFSGSAPGPAPPALYLVGTIVAAVLLVRKFPLDKRKIYRIITINRKNTMR
ncbi:MAG: PQQ-dependent sugar dehydrogenase, partial [Ardenticatenaceae bacterium]